MIPVGLVTPEQRRRNLVLGSLLGVLSIALMVLFIIIFARHGFPKDPSEYKRQQALQQAHSAGHDAEPTAP